MYNPWIVCYCWTVLLSILSKCIRLVDKLRCSWAFASQIRINEVLLEVGDKGLGLRRLSFNLAIKIFRAGLLMKSRTFNPIVWWLIPFPSPCPISCTSLPHPNSWKKCNKKMCSSSLWLYLFDSLKSEGLGRFCYLLPTWYCMARISCTS